MNKFRNDSNSRNLGRIESLFGKTHKSNEYKAIDETNVETEHGSRNDDP